MCQMVSGVPDTIGCVLADSQSERSSTYVNAFHKRDNMISNATENIISLCVDYYCCLPSLEYNLITLKGLLTITHTIFDTILGSGKLDTSLYTILHNSALNADLYLSPTDPPIGS